MESLIIVLISLTYLFVSVALIASISNFLVKRSKDKADISFGDKVVIKKGFHKGLRGVVINRFPDGDVWVLLDNNTSCFSDPRNLTVEMNAYEKAIKNQREKKESTEEQQKSPENVIHFKPKM